jgi:hypothetical protein
MKFSELSWKLMMSEIINAFSIEFIKREKDKMELLLHDIAAQTVADRASFGGILSQAFILARAEFFRCRTDQVKVYSSRKSTRDKQ